MNRLKLSAFLLGASLLLPALALAQQSFTATLDGDQEVPPVMTTASGNATLDLNAAGDALTYTVTLIGLDLDGNQTPANAADDVTGAHIHIGAAGVNGGVAFGFINPGDDVDDLVIDPVAGTISGVWEETDTATGGPLSTQLAALNTEGLYINIHTVGVPAGEVRGQIIGVIPPAAVPLSPATWALLSVLMLLVAGAVLWQRRGAAIHS